MSHIFEGLNEKQREAVLAPDGPVLIIAGAGSGKTKALTHRIAYLIQRGVPGSEILAVTFTNKAAGEMRERVNQLLSWSVNEFNRRTHMTQQLIKLNNSLNSPFIGTFHSFALSVLREEAKSIGFTSRFTVFDEDDSLALIKETMRRLDISATQYPAGVMQSVISSLKGEVVTPDQYNEEPGPFAKTVARIYEAYQTELFAMNAMDFDDLLMRLVLLFEKNPNILEAYQNRYRFIHIDEYQDTNHAQYRLVKLLAAQHRNIFAIGDDAQSIYSWRGADFRNILTFEKDWPDATVVILDQNYRSTQTILDAAHAVISHNTLQKEKRLWTENEKGETIELQTFADERAEAAFVAEKVLELSGGGCKLSDFAVLYRTNHQSRALEEALIAYDIPYRLIGGVKFYQRREIKDLVAYLKVLENGKDFVSLKRIANVPPRGIGKAALAKMLALPNFPEGNLAGLASQAVMTPREKKIIDEFVELISRLKKERETAPPSRFMKYLVKEIRYESYLADDSKNAEERWENVKEFISLLTRYDELPGDTAYVKLLEDIALIQETDAADRRGDAVTLMTLHAAKGLEFRVVFIAGMEEGMFPHGRAAASLAELEEERRLAYVGITRAKEKLYLMWAESRAVFGSREIRAPSRFLKELPRETLKIADKWGLFDSDEEPVAEDSE